MTSAKLLSAVEPVIRYHRDRFRGSDVATPGAPRYELGLQHKEDVMQRLVDVWATGEAGAARSVSPRPASSTRWTRSRSKAQLRGAGIGSGHGIKAARRQSDAPEFIELDAECAADRNAELEGRPTGRSTRSSMRANVLCPATKLWNTGYGATIMREAVSLMGGYGITEDCPGFLGHKWMDAQLEATYEGPEAVQRRQLS
ncbi:MAG: acyl-CoA dehydrogenase family protein [Paludibaculum sp.]